VKAFGMEGFEIRKFREAARNLLRENMRWIRAMAATGPIMDVLGGVVIAMILLYARGEIKVDRMTIGSFGAFTFALFKAYEPIKRLGSISAVRPGAGHFFPSFQTLGSLRRKTRCARRHRPAALFAFRGI